MAATTQNRKTSVVDSQVQWTLALRVVLHFFVFVCAGCILGLVNQFLADPTAGVEANLSAFWKQSSPLMLAMVCLMPIFVRDTLTLSNRIAGPIHNLRRTCRQIANGESNVSPLKFRKRDMWQDLPELFNNMTESLRDQDPATPRGAATVCDHPALERELAKV